MSIFSAVKSLRAAGKSAYVPSDTIESITRLENLGGRLDNANIGRLVENSGVKFTDSQRKLLIEQHKDSDIEYAAEKWEKYRGKKGSLSDRKARELDDALLTRVLKDVQRKNYEDNLEDIKNFNKGKPAKEQKSFTKEYELRPSQPEGFGHILPQETNMSNILGNLESKVSKMKQRTETTLKKKAYEGDSIDFTTLRSLKGKDTAKKDVSNVMNNVIDFNSLKKK
tara:strand:+ start:7373 stop:8047 length:675 start_codon:yes stop_codon:yes gene_type:complete